MDKKNTLYKFLEQVNINWKCIVFWSSCLELYWIESNNFQDVDLVADNIFITELFLKLKELKNINNDLSFDIGNIDLREINRKWFWKSDRLSFTINELNFECFFEKEKNIWIFSKYFDNINFYTNNFKWNFHILKPEYLKESYLKIAKFELISLKEDISILPKIEQRIQRIGKLWL